MSGPYDHQYNQGYGQGGYNQGGYGGPGGYGPGGYENQGGYPQQGGYTESYGGTGYPQGQHHGSQGSQHHSGLLGSLENAAGSFLGKK
ncbi:hypothetical protein DTO164E3_3290 [Paecilomyces variotii]|nr:hypothetical protein DTO164E3_3290 [Paecilomyces variotii]KAJ9221953.1 hypothetical protein DTO169C6_5747 [Paecilomyces variotii]KAJ9263530.1 hypothetical protein DTO195F2_2790 [Paecilomyces variotii]KAJ9325202.1 hypothetical protein DTO027B3_3681 [Paecilomyces variotii]KAJ9331719.1 hypothetical protein DTO027B5_6539 [Paecilomyces variotii]